MVVNGGILCKMEEYLLPMISRWICKLLNLLEESKGFSHVRRWVNIQPPKSDPSLGFMEVNVNFHMRMGWIFSRSGFMWFQALHLALEAVPLWVQSDGARLGTLEVGPVGPVGVSHELGPNVRCWNGWFMVVYCYCKLVGYVSANANFCCGATATLEKRGKSTRGFHPLLSVWGEWYTFYCYLHMAMLVSIHPSILI
jgi:hypothetical protein